MKLIPFWFFLLVMVVFADEASAKKTVNVANNALDTSNCGAADNPCRSISQAIKNAFDGDTIVVGPGIYGDQEFGTPPFAIVIDKELSIISEDGPSATVINVRDTGRWPVKIFASNVNFGRRGHGFMLVANSIAPFSGISVNVGASAVTVEGNLVTGFGRGIDVAGNRGSITNNIVIGNGEGLDIHGEHNTASHNISNGNFGGGGILVSGMAQLITDNIANANTFTGIRVTGGTDHQITENSVIGNGNEGVSLDFPARATVIRNNLYATASNCGLKNNNNVGIVATENFWGAPTGPGPDPADNICNIGAATTDTSSFRRIEVKIPSGSIF